MCPVSGSCSQSGCDWHAGSLKLGGSQGSLVLRSAWRLFDAAETDGSCLEDCFLETSYFIVQLRTMTVFLQTASVFCPMLNAFPGAEDQFLTNADALLLGLRIHWIGQINATGPINQCWLQHTSIWLPTNVLSRHSSRKSLAFSWSFY